MPLDASPERNSNLDNVIKFPEQPKQDQVEMPKSGSHEMSMLVLKEMGFDSLEEARERLNELKAEKAENVHSLAQKIRDKIFNHGKETKKVMDLEAQIADLSRKVRAASATESQNADLESFKKAA